MRFIEKKKINIVCHSNNYVFIFEPPLYSESWNHKSMRQLSWSRILHIINDLRSVLKGYFTKNTSFFYFAEHQLCFNRISRFITKQYKVDRALDCQAPNK